MMEFFTFDNDGGFLLIATDMWNGERKVIGCDNNHSSLSARRAEMKSDPVFNNYYRYSILKLNQRIRPRNLFPRT